jgi:membrane protein YqaA with SNARE-associated domain
MMSAITDLSLPWAATWCFGLTVTSAIVPWINAEVIVLTLPAVASSTTALVALVAVATAGQMTGKCVIYWAARRGNQKISPRIEQRLAPWRRRCEGHPLMMIGLMLWSSIVGMPPFYLMTMVAGALGMNFPVFVAIGTIGRLIRFGGLVAGAVAVKGALL